MSGRQQSSALRFALAAFAILGAGALLPAPALANGGWPPHIETVVVEGDASGKVVMDAAINAEGNETIYDIDWDCTGQNRCQQTEGLLPSGEEHVRLELTGLQAGSTYPFVIHARSTDGEMKWPGEFTVPLQHEFRVQLIPPGACPNGCNKVEERYIPPESPWADEGGDALAARTLQEEREQQQAKEAALLAGEEATRKATQGSQPACVVPALKGDTLSGARRALTNAHCRLGKISRPARRDPRLLITRQNVRHGTKLRTGATVAVTLGPGRPRG